MSLSTLPFVEDERIHCGLVEGPASYATGGFVLDLSASFTTLRAVLLARQSATAIQISRWQITVDDPSAGKATIRVFKHRYSQLASLGTPINQPAGVTVAGTSGQVTGAGSAHSHSGLHTHSFESGVPTAGGAGVGSQPLNPVIGQHTHPWSISGNPTVPTESTHTHVDNVLYQHNHALTEVDTAFASTELPAGTDLADFFFRYAAFGRSKT